MVLVRLAMPEDEAAVLALAKMQVEETLPHLDYDEDVTRATFRDSMDHADPTIFVAEIQGEVVGYAVCLLEGYAFTSGLFVVLEALYVRPESRGSRAAFALVNEFDRWGDLLKAREKILGVANGQDIERKDRFFSRLGFKCVGGYYKKVS